MKRYTIFIIISLLVIFTTAAKGPVKISGIVTDDQNEGLEFVTVKVQGTAIGTITGAGGKYTLTAPEADTIRVVFTCIGFEESKRRLIDASGEVTVNVKMTPASYALGGVEVTDYQKQTSGMQKIDNGNYRLAPDVTGGSVEALISTMAGVSSSNEMSSQYSVRGGSYDENSVYINGIEVYRPQLISSGQQEGLSIVNPDMVGAIGFSTGGFPAQYADRMSSVLDITYRQPEAFEGSVSASLMGASAAVGTSSKIFSQLHGIRYKQNSSLLGSLDDKGEYDPRFFDYQTSMNLKLGEKWSVSLLGNVAVNNYKFIPHNRSTKFGTSTDAKEFTVYFDGMEKDRFETYFGAATLMFRPSKKAEFALQAGGFFTNELVSYDISGEYWLDQAGTSGSEGNEGIGGELGVGKYMEHSRNRLKTSVLQVSFKGTTKYRANNFSYGIGYQHEQFHDRTKEWEWRDSAGYSLPTLPEGVHLVYNLSSRQNINISRLHAYAEDAVYMSNSFAYMTLNAGLRFSYNGFNKEFLVSPRVNFSINPVNYPNWYYRIGAGLYYQSPFYKEYREMVEDDLGNCVIQLNDKIKSPRSIQVIVGADYTFRAMGRPFKLTGEAYYKNLSNLISYEYDNLKINYSGRNDSKGYAMGLDFKLFGQFVEGSDSWISFSLMKTQQTLDGKKVPLPSDQRYAVTAYFTDYFPKFPKLKFSLRGVISDGLTMTPPHTSRSQTYFRAPAYKRVDIGLSWQFVGAPSDGEKKRSGFFGNFKSIVLGLDVFNLLDIANVSSYYWVTDVNNIQYAVPNYLTRRQFNVRLAVEF